MTNRLPELFSYIVATDSGFSPNPFGGICTLACCKPNIRRNANIGDWIIGTTPSPDKGRLVYAMRVDRTLTFDMYWSDPLYACKKPKRHNECGDNIYKLGPNYALVQVENISHHEKDFDSDTSVNRVLISKTFYYFGKEAPRIPAKYDSIIHAVQGHKRIKSTPDKHDAATRFLGWLQENYKQGINGEPTSISAKCKHPVIGSSGPSTAK